MQLLKYNPQNSNRLFVEKIKLSYIPLLFGLLLPANDVEAAEIILNSAASRIEVVDALPKSQKGVDARGNPYFSSKTIHGNNGIFNIELTAEPIFIIEADLPKVTVLPSEYSPFGFHPASGKTIDYSHAEDIGVTWDRGDLYLMWILGQPDLNQAYKWQMFDNYFQKIPAGIRPISNITVAHSQMVKAQNRPKPPGMPTRNRGIDLSNHLQGTSYRPANKAAYSAWVRAVVERYDGDGMNDMQGLRTPVKHWQVDNEPLFRHSKSRRYYPELVLITSKAIKEADPKAKVLLGGLHLPCGKQREFYPNQLPLLRELNGRGIDIVDFHWYGLSGEWKMLHETMKIVRNDLKKYGFDKTPIWFTEIGTYSGKPGGRGRAGLPAQSERTQASEMIKRYTVALSEGVEKLFWAFGMEEGFGNPYDNNFFDNTGFIYDGIGPDDPGKGIKKIIYHTHKKMAYFLQFWDGKSSPERLQTKENVFAYRFRFNNLENIGIIVAWKDG